MRRSGVVAGLVTLIIGVLVMGGRPAAADPSPAASPSSTLTGYWISEPDGTVVPVGDAPFLEDANHFGPTAPIVGIAAAPGRQGYWQVGADGGVFAFGAAGFYGSAGDVRLAKPIVGMASTPDGGGYWLVASDGGVFAYGDARFHGSAGGVRLAKPILGMASTPDGGGYWLVASDGGVFAYGDARFHGSAGGLPLVAPVDAIAATADGGGYWLSAGDGGVFTYGDAPFYGSSSTFAGGTYGIVPTPDGGGYWLPLRYGGGDPEYQAGVYPAGDADITSATRPPASLPDGSQLAPFATSAYPQPPTCQAANLAIAAGQGQFGLSHGSWVFTLTNHGPATCALAGYPGYQATKGGTPVPLTVSDQTGGGFNMGLVVPEPVDVPPGGTASFSLEFLDEVDTGADGSIVTLPGGGQLTLAGRAGTPNDTYATISAIAPGPFAGGYSGG